jgi:hypothetical protein
MIYFPLFMGEVVGAFARKSHAGFTEARLFARQLPDAWLV